MQRRFYTPRVGVLLLLASIFLLAGGCARAAVRGTPPERAITLRVLNHSTDQVAVYLGQGTVPRRVATVPAQGEALVLLYASDLPPLGLARLSLRSLGGREEHVLEEVLVRPGEQLQLTVNGVLQTSQLSARSR